MNDLNKPLDRELDIIAKKFYMVAKTIIGSAPILPRRKAELKSFFQAPMAVDETFKTIRSEQVFSEVEARYKIRAARLNWPILRTEGEKV